MIDVSRVINNPKFAQSYIVHRKINGEWTLEGYKQDETTLNLYGPIVPINTKDLLQVSEGDRATGIMTFYSSQSIYVTRDNTNEGTGTSDEIEWWGERYKIVSITPFNDYGYMKAFGTRMVGN